MVIICGRFEGVDQRVIDKRELEEVSIGDYILSGGEPAATIMLDAIVRLLPGVMGNNESGEHESFENNLLEHPHYTRPVEWEGAQVPEILTGGHHKKIIDWQREHAVQLTKERRPDLALKLSGSAHSIMPALPVTNIKDGVEFYTNTLGFTAVYVDEAGTAVLQLDGVELHLWLSNDESWKTRANTTPPANTPQDKTPIVSGAESFIAGTHSCRIEINGVETLWNKMRGLDCIRPHTQLEKKEWGTTEFSAFDPYGNLITFFEWL